MEKYFPKEKIAVTGNPVRKTIQLNPNRMEEAWKHFELDAEKKTLLVVGGSLGARTINESCAGWIGKIASEGHPVDLAGGRFLL